MTLPRLMRWYILGLRMHYIHTMDGKGSFMKIKGNAEKTAFRRTAEWKNFRSGLLLERGNYCQCCGVKSKKLELHHMAEWDYQNLDKERFVFLCTSCHKEVSRLERIKPENRCKYNSTWVAFYSRFLILRGQKQNGIEGAEGQVL